MSLMASYAIFLARNSGRQQREGMNNLANAARIIAQGNNIYFKRYLVTFL